MDRLQYYLDEILYSCKWGTLEGSEAEDVIEGIEYWAQQANKEYAALKGEGNG